MIDLPHPSPQRTTRRKSGLIYDVIVVGLGAVGSAALYTLAEQGWGVAGVDSQDPPHSLGSSHGKSRIFREAYYEHPNYVPLLRQAFRKWNNLNALAIPKLFRRTGGLMIGPAESDLVAGSASSASQHQIPVERLSSDAIHEHFPAFMPPPEMVGIYEDRAGVLMPELCIRTYLDFAKDLGAHTYSGAAVIDLRLETDPLVVETVRGDITARRVILAAGAWMSKILRSTGVTLPLSVERQTMHWFSSLEPSDIVKPHRFPVSLIEHEPGRIFYVLPDLGDGVKAAIHHEGAIVDPDQIDRTVSDLDRTRIRDLVRRFLPGVDGEISESVVCMYTDTPDNHFILDTLPGNPNVIVASACSGHGFKLSNVVGEIAANLATGGRIDFDISLFSASRFRSS
ncbi:MAG TPA: N-methyl-L-tryptophan oxidase [Gemmatimonadaceae bacterium]|nr:N-methyl-L-tryptophan oxidase [Gemmatimonadaceae bacterium]